MIQTIERSWCLYSSYSMHQSSNFSWICFFKQPASFISFPAYCKTARLYIYDFSVLVQRVLVFVWAIKIVTKITLKGFVGLLSPLPPLIVVERQSLWVLWFLQAFSGKWGALLRSLWCCSSICRLLAGQTFLLTLTAFTLIGPVVSTIANWLNFPTIAFLSRC